MRKILLLVGLLLVSVQGMSAARQKVMFDVKGMTCAFCAYGLEKSLKNVKGVEHVRISLQSKQAILVLRPNKKADDALMKAVKKAVANAGYTPTNLKVKGE